MSHISKDVIVTQQYSFTNFTYIKEQMRAIKMAVNTLAPEIFFLILAHPVYKM